jgi:hypothetical protein
VGSGLADDFGAGFGAFVAAFFGDVFLAAALGHRLIKRIQILAAASLTSAR